MPPRVTLTLESDKQYKEWLAEILASGHGQSRWIRGMVELGRSSPRDHSISLELQRVREERNKLALENELLLNSLQKERAESFKLRSARRTMDEDERLDVAPLLKQGGRWTHRQNVIKIIGKQLDVLKRAGFVEENGSGWRWKK